MKVENGTYVILNIENYENGSRTKTEKMMKIEDFMYIFKLKEMLEKMEKLESGVADLSRDLESIQEQLKKVKESIQKLKEVDESLKEKISEQTERVNSVYIEKSRQYDNGINEFVKINNRIYELRTRKELHSIIYELLQFISRKRDIDDDGMKELLKGVGKSDKEEVEDIFNDIKSFVKNSLPLIDKYLEKEKKTFSECVFVPEFNDDYSKDKYDDIKGGEDVKIDRVFACGYQFPNNFLTKPKITTKSSKTT